LKFGNIGTVLLASVSHQTRQTLGQASCLVLGYKPNDPEERKKAKEHLEKSGLIAVHIRNHDPFQPTAIGIN
ncbi:hypothetical protein CU097_000990, partial [Rhizopus azygosporus]